MANQGKLGSNCHFIDPLWKMMADVTWLEYAIFSYLPVLRLRINTYLCAPNSSLS